MVRHHVSESKGLHLAGISLTLKKRTAHLGSGQADLFGYLGNYSSQSAHFNLPVLRNGNTALYAADFGGDGHMTSLLTDEPVAIMPAQQPGQFIARQITPQRHAAMTSSLTR